ncbi:MAG: hypothetical protein RL263_584 [Bacteroidota bacterium]
MKYQYSRSDNNKMDIWGVFFYILLVVIGFINIFSVTSDVNQTSLVLSDIAYKQLFFIGGAIVIILTLSFANVVLIDYLSYYVYAFVILLNIAVLFIGKEVGGAKSWFGFGGFGIQPSEFLKLATSMALAKFLGGYGMRFSGWKNVTYSIGIFLFPVILILLQNDTGSALVYFSFFLVLYREGMPGYIIILAFWMGLLAILSIVFQGLEISSYYLVGTILGVGSIAVYFARKSRQWVVLITFIAVSSAVFSTIVGIVYDKVFQWYQKDRIEIVLGLKEDKQGMGYNLDQSKVAIGAGRFIGRGFQNGTQTKMGFVPEQHTDFIFCTIGEEWGFVGVIVFFSAFLGLLIRLIQLSERQSDAYGRILGYSVCCILFFHWFVNIGMTIGLIPVIGIPLPFVSAGGSSLWGFTLLLFTFLRYDQVRRN